MHAAEGNDHSFDSGYGVSTFVADENFTLGSDGYDGNRGNDDGAIVGDGFDSTHLLGNLVGSCGDDDDLV